MFGITRRFGTSVAWLVGLASSLAADPLLEIEPPTPGAPIRLSLHGASNSVVALEASDDFRAWEELGRTHDGAIGYPDLDLAADTHRFYRALVRPRGLTDDWKNQVGWAEEPFLSELPPFGRVEPRWVKFALAFDAPHKVVFQDSAKYPFHYDFATVRIPQFQGMTRAQFDAVTLRADGQRAVLGAVLVAPTTNLLEAGVQFVGLDPYPREQVAEWFETVRAMLVLPPGTQVYYIPTFEQAEVARQNLEWFTARGIQVSSADRWVIGDECYAPGWAVGRMVFVPAEQIDTAYRAGQLRPDDLLLTDAVPAEVPPLAGLIALAPATPNSHVALLAQAFGIPFVYFADPATRDRLQALAGRDVLLRAIQLFGGCEAFAAGIEGGLNDALRAEFQTLKAPPRLNLPPKTSFGQISVSTEGLRPVDSRHVGGKAANFGLLRRSIATNAPSPAIALTFDLWDGYLDQTLPGGQTLRAAVAQRLGGFTWPPDMGLLKTRLAEIRELFTDDADFTADQEEAIIEVLQQAGFDPLRNIRFRSSTNVEDSEQFSGAGLYDSYSGCLADDLDDDNRGPSICDPTETNERGVFRALRRVYASFYNDNAFLERLRHGVDESAVGMGVLVHHSTPDPFELANGVATLQVFKEEQRGLEGELVTQLGAVSVANPDSTARPERIRVSMFPGGPPFLEVLSRSSLVPLGDHVLTWEAEYQQLFRLLDTAAKAYEAEFPARKQLTLDFEYKKVAPEGRLRIKQIREVPRVNPNAPVPTYLLNTTNRYAVFQGEFGDIIANHRLKSFWALQSRSLKLVASNLTSSLLTQMAGEWLDGTNHTTMEGAPAQWPGYSYAPGTEYTADRWRLGATAEQRDFELRIHKPFERTAQLTPLVTLGDQRIELRVRYATAQPTLGFDPLFTTTLEEGVELGPIRPVSAESLQQERVFRRGNVEIRTSFYWPPPPKGITAGYTAPVQAWIQTTLSGFTSRPIILRSDWSQTYRPGHHNFYEEFAFEPRLDPDSDPETLAELASQNIRAVIVGSGMGEPPAVFVVWGLDGRFRNL